jgi:nickel-dependent lactate racemase
MVELPYGRVPYPVELGGRDVTVLTPAPRSRARPLDELLDEALDAPIGAPSLDSLPSVRPGARITLIVSDASRAEPRGAFVRALRARLPAVDWTIAIATGTHGPSALEPLGLPSDLGARIVNHDGHRSEHLVELGTTARGTPVRVHRCVVDADLVIATGCIRPHYFAGFGAGVKAIFPGLGEAAAIRANHALKTERGARAGIVDGNPCREDLEDAVALVSTPTFLLNGVCAPDDRIHAAVAGDLRAAFRRGAELARPWFTVRSSPAPVVIASDALPVTASLYQAAKIAAAVAPIVEANGTLLLVAECPDGTGPLPVVNEAIFRIGVLPRFAPGVSIRLVSSLSPSTVACTLVDYAASVADVLAAHPGRVVVVPRASQLIVEGAS